MRRRRQRLLAALDPQRPRHPRQPGAEGEYFNVRRRLHQRMGETQIVLRTGLHRAGDIDQKQHLARPRTPLQPSEPHHLAVVARGLAQGAPQVRPGAASRAPAAMAAPPWQAGRGLAGQTAQRVAGASGSEAALDQRFGASCHDAGFIGLVGESGLLAVSLVLQPNDLVVLGFAARKLVAAEEVDLEQVVIGGAPLRRRRQRRKPGLPDVFQSARTEKIDCREEGYGLLRRDGKAVAAQQGHEGDEGARGARQVRLFAHATASAISASSRGAMKTRSSSSLSATPIERLKASGQRVPPRLSKVAASAQSTASAMPGNLLRGSRRSLPTAATTARAVASATLEARIITIRASRSAVG